MHKQKIPQIKKTAYTKIEDISKLINDYYILIEQLELTEQRLDVANAKIENLEKQLKGKKK